MSSPSHTSSSSSSSRRPHLTSPTRAPRLDIPGPMPQSVAEPSGENTPSYIVISGGTGCNAICAAFAHASYVLPVSDDGGSSSEIIRVLGGPSIGKRRLPRAHLLNTSSSIARAGDIRSRLIRLIPPAPPGTPLDAVRTLLAHRLPSGADAEQDAREEWRTIVEGRSHLWVGIPEDRKETIRGTR
jgi:hypothetical protein